MPVTFSGLTQLVVRMQELRSSVPANVTAMMDRLGADTKAAMDTFTHVRTGVLKAGNELLLEEKAFTLQNNVYYAKFVEFGTRKMTARPFLGPAVEAAIQELPSRILEVFQ